MCSISRSATSSRSRAVGPKRNNPISRHFRPTPENPDYAYNLAVSLDQLRQPKLALDYYRRALALAQTRAASFDQALARIRVQALSQAAR